MCMTEIGPLSQATKGDTFMSMEITIEGRLILNTHISMHCEHTSQYFCIYLHTPLFLLSFSQTQHLCSVIKAFKVSSST